MTAFVLSPTYKLASIQSKLPHLIELPDQVGIYEEEIERSQLLFQELDLAPCMGGNLVLACERGSIAIYIYS
jgi:hypothetical protein